MEMGNQFLAGSFVLQECGDAILFLSSFFVTLEPFINYTYHYPHPYEMWEDSLPSLFRVCLSLPVKPT